MGCGASVIRSAVIPPMQGVEQISGESNAAVKGWVIGKAVSPYSGCGQHIIDRAMRDLAGNARELGANAVVDVRWRDPDTKNWVEVPTGYFGFFFYYWHCSAEVQAKAVVIDLPR
jgi:hypothetical protein